MSRVSLPGGRVIETCDEIMDDDVVLERSQRIADFHAHLHYLDSVRSSPLTEDELKSEEFKAYSKHFDKICEDVDAKYVRPRKKRIVELTGQQAPVTASQKTVYVRGLLESKWPAEYRDGARCGAWLSKGGYPRGFAAWPLERKNAWFAGFNKEYSERPADARAS